jgi:hypothetical protein
MGKLKDYSGKFIPDIKLEDFSEGALQRIWKCGGDLYMGVFELYNDLIKRKFGEEKAIEFSRELWLGEGATEQKSTGKGFLRSNENATKRAIRVIREASNILGDDVESYFKLLQLDPTMGPFTEAEFELKDKNHGIYTVKRCHYLDMMWEAGDDVKQKHVCEVLDGIGFDMVARQFNPKMRGIALKFPQKGSKIACQWEIKIE